MPGSIEAVGQVLETLAELCVQELTGYSDQERSQSLLDTTQLSKLN